MSKAKSRKNQPKHNHRAKPVSLYPLSFPDALAGLLQTELPPKEHKPQTKKRDISKP